jgi:hypothetical protein
MATTTRHVDGEAGHRVLVRVTDDLLEVQEA